MIVYSSGATAWYARVVAFVQTNVFVTQSVSSPEWIWSRLLLPSIMSTMSSPELVYCALVALAGYALFLISSHMKAKNDPPTRRRRAQPAVPVATAGSGTAHATVVHPRRKVIQRNLSVVYENESDIEEVAPYVFHHCVTGVVLILMMQTIVYPTG